jgi:hypothetical protein
MQETGQTGANLLYVSFALQFKLPFSGLNFTSGVEDPVGAGVEDGGGDS